MRQRRQEIELLPSTKSGERRFLGEVIALVLYRLEESCMIFLFALLTLDRKLSSEDQRLLDGVCSESGRWLGTAFVLGRLVGNRKVLEMMST